MLALTVTSGRDRKEGRHLGLRVLLLLLRVHFAHHSRLHRLLRLAPLPLFRQGCRNRHRLAVRGVRLLLRVGGVRILFGLMVCILSGVGRSSRRAIRPLPDPCQDVRLCIGHMAVSGGSRIAPRHGTLPRALPREQHCNVGFATPPPLELNTPHSGQTAPARYLRDDVEALLTRAVGMWRLLRRSLARFGSGGLAAGALPNPGQHVGLRHDVEPLLRKGGRGWLRCMHHEARGGHRGEQPRQEP